MNGGISPRGRTLRALVCLLTVVLAGGRVARLQDHRGERDAYLALLARYESGDREGAAWAVLAFDFHLAREVQRQVADDRDADLVDLVRMASNGLPFRQEFNRRRRARVRVLTLSLMAHTEAALHTLEPERLGQQLTLAGEVVARLRGLEGDFRANGPLDFLDDGPGMLAPARPEPSAEERARLGRPEWEALALFVKDWYALLVSHLQEAGAPEMLDALVARGLESYPGDAALLLARGTLAEGRARASIIDRSLAGDLYQSDYRRLVRQRLRKSLDDFEDAIQGQPDLHEARLRRGRVNSHLGNRNAARRDLEEVTAGDAPARLRSLAWLFLGELEEQERRWHQAREAYERALALSPRAQAPMLALSRLCDAGGDRDCARRWLQRSFDALGRDRADPWWDYLRGQAWQSGPRLTSLRAQRPR